MMARRTLSAFIGITQTIIGASAILFAYILYHNFLDARVGLNISLEHMPLYLFLLFIFGFFSVISGYFLIHEWLESK